MALQLGVRKWVCSNVGWDSWQAISQANRSKTCYQSLGRTSSELRAYFYLGRSLRCPIHTEVGRRKSADSWRVIWFDFSSNKDADSEIRASFSGNILARKPQTVVRTTPNLLPIYRTQVQYVLWVLCPWIFDPRPQLGGSSAERSSWDDCIRSIFLIRGPRNLNQDQPSVRMWVKRLIYTITNLPVHERWSETCVSRFWICNREVQLDQESHPTNIRNFAFSVAK